MNMYKTSTNIYSKRLGNALIEDRLKKLEEKVFKLGKPPTTRSQQILLMHHLGLLDIILKLKISNKKKSILLSTILNSSQDNIEGDLSNIFKKKSPLRTPLNYAFLHKTFTEVGLIDLAVETENEYNNLQNEQDKLKSIK
jgi:hypothetical protein